MNCDLDIIGITQTTCECFEPDEEESLSGLYLSELEGFSLQLLLDHEVCEYGTWKEHMLKGIYNAKAELHKDVVQGLTASNFYEKVKPIYGQIGHDRKVTLISTSKQHLVYRMVLNNLRDTKVKIKNIGLYFQNANPLSCRIYDVFGTLLDTVALAPAAGKYVVDTFDYEFDCYMPGVKYAEYFLVIDISNNKPYSLKHLCCGDKYTFNYNRPCFTERQNVTGWRSVAMVGYDIIDFNANNIDTYRTLCPTYKTLCGIVLDISTRCDTWKLVCNELIDYKTDDLGISIALALRYKAASMLFQDILNRPNVELKQPDGMLASVQMWDAKYKDHINYMTSADTILQYTDCFKLRNRMARVGGRL